MAYDAIVVSDIHLGSRICEADAFVRFLQDIDRDAIETKLLVLDGDTFDSLEKCRLTGTQLEILSLVAKIAEEETAVVVVLRGNHDPEVTKLRPLLSCVKFADECVVKSENKDFLVLHGHQFDTFLKAHPILTEIGDSIYRFLQRVDPTHFLARYAKKSSKTFLKCAQTIKERACEYARAFGFDYVICGHTHHPEIDATQVVGYANCGSWAERPSTFLVIENGVVNLCEFRRS